MKGWVQGSELRRWSALARQASGGRGYRAVRQAAQAGSAGGGESVRQGE